MHSQHVHLPGASIRRERCMEQNSFETFWSTEAAIDQLRSVITQSERFVLLVCPASMLEEIETELRSARDRGVLVLLLIGDDTDDDRSSGVNGTIPWPSIATIVRQWDPIVGFEVVCTTDRGRGIIIGYDPLYRDEQTETVAYANDLIETKVFSTILGNFWPLSRELYVAPPNPLPHEYESLYHAIVDARHYLENDHLIEAAVTGYWLDEIREPGTVEGPVINVHQSFIYPATSAFFGENNLVVETADGPVTIGGHGSFVEDFEATHVTLSPV